MKFLIIITLITVFQMAWAVKIESNRCSLLLRYYRASRPILNERIMEQNKAIATYEENASKNGRIAKAKYNKALSKHHETVENHQDANYRDNRALLRSSITEDQKKKIQERIHKRYLYLEQINADLAEASKNDKEANANNIKASQDANLATANVVSAVSSMRAYRKHASRAGCNLKNFPPPINEPKNPISVCEIIENDWEEANLAYRLAVNNVKRHKADFEANKCPVHSNTPSLKENRSGSIQ